MDACDYCHGFERVTWNDEAGDICDPCLTKREAEKERERDEAERAEIAERLGL